MCVLLDAYREAVCKAIMRNRPSPLKEQPGYIWQVLRKMMATDPSQRYAKLADAFDDLANGRSPDLGVVEEEPARKEFIQVAVAEEPLGPRTLELLSAADALAADIIEFKVTADDVAHLKLANESRKNARRQSALRQVAIVTGYLRAAVVFLAVFMLCAHALHSKIDYQYATVSAITGSPMISTNGVARLLVVGDRIDSSQERTIVTGDSSTVLLALRGARIKLMQNSIFKPNMIGYHDGADREFTLAKGSVLQCVDPRHRVGAVYSTSVGNVGVFVTGTRFEVDLTPTGHVDVTTVEGNVNVQVGAQHAQVASGQHIDIDPSPDRGASPQAADEAVLEKFNGQADLLAEGGLVQQADAALGVFEDQVVLRLLDDMSFLRKHDPVETAWKDTRSILTAQVAMKSICSMLQASANGDLPATIDLQTLEPLDLPAKDVKRILSGFEGHQLQSYQLLSHDHYTFTARVANSAHTLLRATDGVVETVAEHTTSNAIAPRSQSTDASDQ